MLRSLYIRNYALIDELTVAFDNGLNIITGETGAGKSIVLGAFGLLIGDRASSDIVRHGADKMVVEAEFNITGNPRLHTYLVEKEIECNRDTLLIRREVSSRGTSRGFINDSPATTQILKELGGFLVDLHGQHEHQSLLHADNHIILLDDFGALGLQVNEFKSLRTRVLQVSREIEELKQREAKLLEERDLYEFQHNEIVEVDPHPGEDNEIENELRVLENSEELRDISSQIHSALYEEDGSIFERLGNTKDQLETLQKIDHSLEEPLRETKSALAVISELSKWFSRYLERIELDPVRLATLRDRMQRIQRLKKKYGGTLEAVLEKKLELRAKLSFEEQLTHSIKAKQKELETMRTELGIIAGRLSKARHELANTLEPIIVTELKELGIEHAAFKVGIGEKIAEETSGILTLQVGQKNLIANARGVDDVEFYISTNAGESPKQLTRVASGGEISRVMLALKTALAKNDRLPLLVFDEIDIGISGRIAQHVGRAMKTLSAAHQIISITHLAQIAAFADAHYVAEKHTTKGTTVSYLRRLSATEHAEEVARLISGDTVSESSLDTARTLIEEASSNQKRAYTKKASLTR